MKRTLFRLRRNSLGLNSFRADFWEPEHEELPLNKVDHLSSICFVVFTRIPFMSSSLFAILTANLPPRAQWCSVGARTPAPSWEEALDERAGGETLREEKEASMRRDEEEDGGDEILTHLVPRQYNYNNE